MIPCNKSQKANDVVILRQLYTDTKRQATQHGCMPSWLGDGDKGVDKVYGEEKSILYMAYCRAESQGNKNLLYRQDKPKEPTKEGPLSFVLFESPFTSVSTLSVSRGHPLSSLSGYTAYAAF